MPFHLSLSPPSFLSLLFLPFFTNMSHMIFDLRIIFRSFHFEASLAEALEPKIPLQLKIPRMIFPLKNNLTSRTFYFFLYFPPSFSNRAPGHRTLPQHRYPATSCYVKPLANLWNFFWNADLWNIELDSGTNEKKKNSKKVIFIKALAPREYFPSLPPICQSSEAFPILLPIPSP